MLRLEKARAEDFEDVFPLIKALWSYNSYDEAQTKTVFERIAASETSFAFVAREYAETDSCGCCVGFCHGDYFPTLWMCGQTCYLSGIITQERERGRGIGKAMLSHVKELALERGCKAVILESGLQRTPAHRFYEAHGFEKSCYGFECIL